MGRATRTLINPSATLETPHNRSALCPYWIFNTPAICSFLPVRSSAEVSVTCSMYGRRCVCVGKYFSWGSSPEKRTRIVFRAGEEMTCGITYNPSIITMWLASHGHVYLHAKSNLTFSTERALLISYVRSDKFSSGRSRINTMFRYIYLLLYFYFRPFRSSFIKWLL